MTVPTTDDLVLMWSGGKDAMLTLDVLHSQSPRRVGALLTTVREDTDAVTMHGTPLTLIEEQADRMGLSLHVMRVPPRAPNEVYEDRLEQALRPLLSKGYTTVAAGDLFLEDVKAYRESVLTDLGARPLFPLWKRDTDWLARRFVERGYRAVITSVDTTQLDPHYVGQAFDDVFLDDLPEHIDPCGEHGEFHTFVTAGPPLQSSIKVEVGEPYDDRRMRCVTVCPSDDRTAAEGRDTKPEE